ncbi:MAG: hypothetical protein HFJ50_09525 [Clostridia bacterium]|nr:hypothetical protein [Clostridia bacterium]
MKIKGKRIAFCLTGVFYAFRHTINEIKNLVKEGGEVIPIMSLDDYEFSDKSGELFDFVQEIEEICMKKVICDISESEIVQADIVCIAPCSRKQYF